jgi:hypothetical protein
MVGEYKSILPAWHAKTSERLGRNETSSELYVVGQGDMYVQSTSVWSRGRYLMPCDSSSCSTSSGIRPFTVIAYNPRAYLSTP